MDPPPHVEIRLFADDGRTPNHPALPLVLIRETPAAEAEDPAEWFEQTFVRHGWGATWRWGIYPFHHFHSTNHEVLGVSTGEARLMLGGENGEVFAVKPGDVIVIPAGVGHQCVDASDDFQVVGAYPDAREPDLIRSGEGGINSARRRISEVPLPREDPIHGGHGTLLQHWKA